MGLGVLAGACPQARSSERQRKTDEILCRKSVALDLARGSYFPLAAFQEVCSLDDLGSHPWWCLTWEALVRLWDQQGSVGAGSQGDCGDLLGHKTGPPLGRLCAFLFPRMCLVKMLILTHLV